MFQTRLISKIGPRAGRGRGGGGTGRVRRAGCQGQGGSQNIGPTGRCGREGKVVVVGGGATGPVGRAGCQGCRDQMLPRRQGLGSVWRAGTRAAAGRRRGGAAGGPSPDAPAAGGAAAERDVEIAHGPEVEGAARGGGRHGTPLVTSLPASLVTPRHIPDHGGAGRPAPCGRSAGLGPARGSRA
jgi:hypothetical protein